MSPASPAGRRQAGAAGLTLRCMAGRADRPFTTALGWRLPPRLLDFGPVAFIFLVGCAALVSNHKLGGEHHTVRSSWASWCSPRRSSSAIAPR